MRRPFSWWLATGLSLCGLLSACGQRAPDGAADADAAAVAEPADTTRYTDAANRFSIALPVDWQQQANYLGTAISAFGAAPAEGAEPPVLNVSIEPLAKPYALDEYARLSRERLASAIVGFEELGSGDGSLGGQPAKWLLAHYRLNDREVKALVHFALFDKQAIVVTALASPAQFDQLEPRFRSLVESFRYLPAAEAGPS